jgi:SNF2 family DNA or RNA helicase
MPSLGKTLAVISVIMRGLKAKNEVQDGNDKSPDGPTLIVCPLSVLYTWADQLEKHTDGSARILL